MILKKEQTDIQHGKMQSWNGKNKWAKYDIIGMGEE